MIRKFWDKDGKYIEDNEPIFLSGHVKGGTPRFHARPEKDPTSMPVLDNPNASITKMMRDKTMMKMLKERKGSDKGIKREALAIEVENNTKRKTKWLEKKKANLAKMKKEFGIK